MASSQLLNLRPLSCDFTFGNKKKSQVPGQVSKGVRQQLNSALLQEIGCHGRRVGRRVVMLPQQPPALQSAAVCCTTLPAHAARTHSRTTGQSLCDAATAALSPGGLILRRMPPPSSWRSSVTERPSAGSRRQRSSKSKIGDLSPGRSCAPTSCTPTHVTKILFDVPKPNLSSMDLHHCTRLASAPESDSGASTWHIACSHADAGAESH